MKKLLLAAAVTTLSISAVQAAPTLYGKLNVTIDQVDNSDFNGNNVTEINSNASRLGVKGEEKLTDKISAVYLAEWEVSTDGNDEKDWGMRNRFLGLKFADIGTLKAGRYDSYFKTAAGKYQDIFNDHNHLDITSTMYGEDRLNNSIGFETDKKLLAGLQFKIMAEQGESSTEAAEGTTGNDSKRNGFGDAISTSLTYENKDLGLVAALAGNFGAKGKYNGLDGEKYFSNAVRVTGSYDLGKVGVDGLVVGALYQQAEPTDDVVAFKNLEEQAWLVSATYSIPNTPWAVKGQYQSAETTADNMKDHTIDQYGIGVDYSFNKQARLYGVLAQQERDWKNGPDEDDTKTVLGLGMEYNF